MPPLRRVALLAAVLAGCTFTRYMDNQEAQTAIGDHFNAMFPVHSVKCEDKVELKAGATFTCQLRFNGATEALAVKAEITEVVNKRGKFNFKFVDEVFDPRLLEKEIATGVKARTGTDAKVDCGAPRRPKTGDTCQVTGSAAEQATVVLTAGADGKLEKWEIQ